MVEFTLVLSTKDGKSYQKTVQSPYADALLDKHMGSTISGDALGYAGYEFQLTGGSDKAGFPMRKGIVDPRKKVLIGKSVGFSGVDRHKKRQPGLLRRRTVCGEMITKYIQQVNLKVLKEGAEKLVAEKKAE